MDLLCRAYAAASDDDDEGGVAKDLAIPPLPSKRMRSSSSYHPHHQKSSNQSSSFLVQSAPVVAAADGRYLSKRERAMLSSSTDNTPPQPHTVSTSPVVGSIADSDLPSDILASLRCRTTVHANKIAGRSSILLNGHSNAVNSIQWSRTHAHLLASAGMDQTVNVWNVWSKDQKQARIFKCHNAAIKDVKCSPEGLSLLSSGYDCASRLVDVEKGAETQLFKEDQVVDTIRFHPRDSCLFLSGGSKGILRLWDTRCNKVAHEYVKGLGPILDM